jgi:hypothetical protein
MPPARGLTGQYGRIKDTEMANRSAADRFFYVSASLLFVALTAIGFAPFILRGREFGEDPIPEHTKIFVIAHGVALLTWIVLFPVQSFLIASKRVKIHRTLGWFAAAVAGIVVTLGICVALTSVRDHPNESVAGLTYPQFLLPMFAEMTAFTVFVALCVAYRKRSRVHAPFMMLATLSVISGSTARIPATYPIFGEIGWMGLFGCPALIAAILLIVKSVIDRRVDWTLTAGGAVLYSTYFVIMHAAQGPVWAQIAANIVRH